MLAETGSAGLVVVVGATVVVLVVVVVVVGDCALFVIRWPALTGC